MNKDRGRNNFPKRCHCEESATKQSRCQGQGIASQSLAMTCSVNGDVISVAILMVSSRAKLLTHLKIEEPHTKTQRRKDSTYFFFASLRLCVRFFNTCQREDGGC